VGKIQSSRGGKVSQGVKHEPDVAICIHDMFPWSRSKRSPLCLVLGCPWIQQRYQFRGSAA
jgi:hypothetical protein